MEKIWMIILFLAPGLMFHALDRKVFMRGTGKHEAYDYIFKIVAHSIVISAACLMIVKFAAYILDIDCRFRTLSDIRNMMNSLCFLAGYMAVMVIITLLYWYYYHRLIKSPLQKIAARFTLKFTGNETHGYENIYDEIFSNKERAEHLMPVTILQNGTEITSGVFTGYNTSDQDRREFTIEYQDEINEILTNDRKVCEEERILPYIDLEYYDADNNMLIRFYNPKRLEKYWAAKYSD